VGLGKRLTAALVCHKNGDLRASFPAPSCIGTAPVGFIAMRRAVRVLRQSVARIDFTTRRLFVDAPLRAGLVVGLTGKQANYLINVLRLADGSMLLVFNGRDGEWRARLSVAKRKSASLAIEVATRPQENGIDLDLLFAPLKHGRLDYMVQKAVEMGVTRLVPIVTHRTQVGRVNQDRMQANVIEAAEQCGILRVPEVAKEIPLSVCLATWPGERLTIFCDEDGPARDPIAALVPHRHLAGAQPPMAVVIGPEGGFDETERQQILILPNLVRLSLGPRVLRADTAAVAALALVQAVLGDWR
jgi:16S rRNA (uracil1498-N3)-methyltransferase